MRQGSEFLTVWSLCSLHRRLPAVLVKGSTLWPHHEATSWVAREAEGAEVQLTW